MKSDIGNLVNKIKDECNPLIIANEISYFISDNLKQKKINLYEAYSLNAETIRFRRLGYTQPAWNGRVRISICIELMNQKLLANIFDEEICSQKFMEWASEAFILNKEKRAHYILDKYSDYLRANSNKDLLLILLDIRQRYNELSFDEGPYHNESFPYDYYVIEEILLSDEKKSEFCKNKTLNEDVENLIVELNLLHF